MVIRIRRANITDKNAIYEFLREAYADNSQYKFPERWNWQFVRNPYKPDDGLPVWIAEDEDGTIAGQSCAMYEPIKIGNSTYVLAWALDAYVLPEYRGNNLGYETLKMNCESNDLWMGLVMAESSRHILTKLGCVPTETVNVFSRLMKIDSEKIVRFFDLRLNSSGMRKSILWIIRFTRFHKISAAILNIGVQIVDQFTPLRYSSEISIHQIKEFDENINELWSRISPQFKIIIQRTHKFLNYKYVEQPFMNYLLFTAYNDRELKGYIILRHAKPPESNTGIIADLFASPEERDVIHALLAHSLRYFKNVGANYVQAASSIPEYQKAFMAFGFRKVKVARPLFLSRLEKQRIPSKFPAGSWFLGRSDHDWDQYPYG